MSPFPQQYHPPDNFPDHDLPPSDPPPTSSLRLDERLRLPPIEFLLPEPNDSDAPLPSSHPGEHVDELQEPKTTIRNNGLNVPQPPPTFFAGSSSPAGVGAQTPAAPSPKRPPAVSNLIDLTDIPSTLVEPAAPVPNIGDLTNAKKARKPRKPRKKPDVVDDGSRPEKTLQTSKKNKGKGNLPTVVVEIPIPPPGFDRERKRKHRDALQSDEPHLNDNGAVAGPSSLMINNDKEDDTNLAEVAMPPETESVPPKGRRRKRKEAPDLDGSNHVVPCTFKATDNFGGSETAEKSPPATRRPSKKRKQSDEDKAREGASLKSSRTVRVMKGKGRNVIESDDDDGDDAQLNQEDSPLLSKEQEGEEAESEAIEANASHGNLANQVPLQHDRDLLKVNFQCTHVY